MSKYGTNGSGIFLSTPSARRATSFSMRLRLPTRNFYPRPPRGGRHDLRAGQGPRSEISIHALREEGDGSQPDALTVPTISIHALREEGDRIRHGPAGREVYFYPRPPRGGRHLESVMLEQTDIDFYPRPPRGGRPTKEVQSFAAAIFLSTPSARRATVAGQAHSIRAAISIHALREEGDFADCEGELLQDEFLSTPSARRATAATA